MLVSLKAEKNAKSGQTARQFLVPMTLRAPMPTLPAQAGSISSPAKSSLFHIEIHVNKQGIRAGNPELSAFRSGLSTTGCRGLPPDPRRNPEISLDACG
jgi:hypothetical protein